MYLLGEQYRLERVPDYFQTHASFLNPSSCWYGVLGASVGMCMHGWMLSMCMHSWVLACAYVLAMRAIR